ncbi:hypothetical protein AJ80_04211 [Polytolypa hystricis UAMH7299]|uniref:Gryzun putative trafficking through Golgi domain-containing protein n=1 Tax=Polytolypa hystricis (strain UAMH7299) TaxID=1447883 RepID=A0A2B7YDL6_POLH7|nr:hypothetical protein AJ80_04211 [Polytolypa hystricis UAMH7299]
MDAYPPDYVGHNLPLVLLSGLGSDNDGQDSSTLAGTEYPLLLEHGVQIFSDIPPLTEPNAERLLNALLSEDASNAPWNARNDAGKAGTVGFRVKRVGRTYTLPPRKAVSPMMSAPDSLPHSPTTGMSVPLALHSPISPLSPSSLTFPDGMMTPLWVTKHQNLVPAAFVNFFPFATDPNMASLRDNQLKIEINGLKKSWTSSGYKTRFVVALLCEDGDVPDDANERLSGIRRATNLDPKSVFILPPDPSQEDIKEFVRSLFHSLQAPSAEYYRDLSKHARRKRSRGTIPPPTAPPTSGTSQTLSSQGWNIRYDFKLGVFAEFRQEMDAACRSYETAYDSLFGEEVFETIAGWSPRFNDARMLADVLAIRIIRCLLWTDQTTSAVRMWLTHRNRIQGIVGRRGKGTKNYGWEAWEARWSLVMAQIIHQAEVSSITLPDLLGSVPNVHKTIYAMPEKAIPIGERMSPWEYLHHEGYWLHRAAKHTARRRLLAGNIAEEDRVSPSQPTASHATNRSTLYDTYLAPEPYVEYPSSGQQGTDYPKLIRGFLELAIEEFSKRGQVRMVEQLRLDMAKEHMRDGDWNSALNIIRPLWDQLSWRRDGWWALMEDFAWTLRECALKAQDGETVLQVDWELMNRTFTPRKGWQYNLHKSLEELPLVKPKPAVVLKGEDAVPSLTASFAFAKSEGNVGEPLLSQLVIKSCAHTNSTPISLSEVKIVFEGSLRPIRLLADTDTDSGDSSPCEVLTVPLHDSTASDSSSVQSPTGGMAAMIGTTNLTFNPSRTRAFDLTSIPREPGEARVASIALMIEEEEFAITSVVTEQMNNQLVWWEVGNRGPFSRKIGKDRNPGVSQILPKPPKVRITTPNLRDHYYTDERVVLDIRIENEEDEAAEVTVEIKLFRQSDTSAKLYLLDDTDSDSDPESEDASTNDGATETESLTQISRRSLKTLPSGGSSTLSALFTNTTDPIDYEIEVSAFYHLVSDAETPIFKTVTLELSFIRPFEANYEFLPRLHPAPWPDFFRWEEAAEEGGEKPGDLKQRWCLNSKIVSFAPEPLIIEEVTVSVLGVTGGRVSELRPEKVKGAAVTGPIGREELRETESIVEIQRLSPGDRRPTSIHLSLDIRWRRPGSEEEGGEGGLSTSSVSLPTTATTTTTTTTADPCTTSSLPIPRFLVPMSEPRVLASAMPSTRLPGFFHVDYTLENPSMHFLTFTLTMEASDQFAFSGPKTTALQLVPLSRHTVRYSLLATTTGTTVKKVGGGGGGGVGAWIQPQLLVVDSYFNKTLRVLGTEGMGMRVDKKGILVWVEG